jgi:hypothetical protein
MHTNGTFDASFGGDGIVTNEFEGGPDQINGLALQADGKLVATGVVYRLFPDSYDIGVARYQAGGAATPTPTRTATRTPTNTPTTAPTQTPGGPTATPVPSVTACPIQFPDVSPGSTFHDFVRCLACRGIVNGLSDGTFGPNNPVTRGQLSKIVSNAAGFSENIGNNSFEDVPVGSTFHQFVERLFLRGIINGFNCGGPGEPCVPPQNKPYFRPNANVTRAQTSKIVASAAGFPAPPSGQQSFEDAQEGSTFWQWIEALAGRAIINGFACGNPEPCVPPGNRPYFRPNNQVTRGQSAKIVANTFFPECVTPQRAK